MRGDIYKIMLASAMAAFMLAGAFAVIGGTDDVQAGFSRIADSDRVTDASGDGFYAGEKTLDGRGFGTCGDGVLWALEDDGSLTITYSGEGTGEMDNFTEDGKPPWYGEHVNTVTIGDGVKSIGNFAFKDCKSLYHVEIAPTVESIGDGAFNVCTSLCSIKIPSSVTSIGYAAFLYCTSLTSIDLGGSIDTIREDTFYGCGLIAIDVPGTVRTIEEQAFAACEDLEIVILREGLKSIGACTFAACGSLQFIYIPTTVTEIGDYPFDVDFYDYDGETVLEYSDIAGYCYESIDGKLTKQLMRDDVVDTGVCGDGVIWTYYADQTLILSYSGNGTGAMFDYDGKENKTPWYANEDYKPVSIIVEEGVTSLGAYGFAYCGAATSIQLPSSLVSMGEAVFYGCASMTSFDFPENVHEIPDRAFGTWMGLREITIPSTVTTLGDGVFQMCNRLNTVIMEPGVQHIGSELFDYCWSLESVVLPEGLLTIGERAFANADITTIIIPSTVEEIPDEAFWMCSDLESVQFSEGLKSIGSKAFYMSDLTEIILPNGLVSIGDGAFESCSDVSKLSIPATVESIGDGAFDFFFNNTFYDYDGETVLTMDQLPGYVYEGDSFDHKFVRTGVTTVGGGQCGDGLEWTLYGNGNLEIAYTGEGTGAMYDYTFTSPAPWYGHDVAMIFLGDGVTYIGSLAFMDLDEVLSITVNEDLQSVCADAFPGAKFFIDYGEVQPSAENLAGKVWTAEGSKQFHYHSEGLVKVVFDPVGGICDVEAMYAGEDGLLPYLPEPEKEGYKFMGWFTKASGGKEITESTVFDEDTTVYAHWESLIGIPEKAVAFTVIVVTFFKELFKWF